MKRTFITLVLALLFTTLPANAQNRKTVGLRPVKQNASGGHVLSFEERRSIRRETKAPEEKTIPSREQRKLVPSNAAKRNRVLVSPHK
jgi:hypothetical protein